MAPHSSTLAWKIPWMGEPGGLQSMGSRRGGRDWATLLSLFTFMHWRRKWQPTPVFLPGESQGQRSLVGCRHGVAQSRTRLTWQQQHLLCSSYNRLEHLFLSICYHLLSADISPKKAYWAFCVIYFGKIFNYKFLDLGYLFYNMHIIAIYILFIYIGCYSIYTIYCHLYCIDIFTEYTHTHIYIYIYTYTYIYRLS